MCAIRPGWTGPLLPERLQALVKRGWGLMPRGRAFEVRRGTGRHLLAPTPAGRAPLTAAEQRAARLFAHGLGLSERTARTRLAAACETLGVTSKAERGPRRVLAPAQSRN